eukprot:COSAG02_NODE_50146_length_322_cov_0.923767_1_plen_44_part_10
MLPLLQDHPSCISMLYAVHQSETATLIHSQDPPHINTIGRDLIA